MTPSSRTGVQFYLGKRLDKIEHVEIGTCARTEISQDADNKDQKLKWFLKVHNTKQTFVESIFLIIFLPKLFLGSHIGNFSILTPLKMNVLLANW